MRFIYALVLILIIILEIGPFPITGLILLWVVIARPVWFYEWVMKLYDRS